ncbi:MAG TPA: Smr/MutS family protein [Telluria sp.]|nr:Smr/MutS family protein [Telluria sp.]
MATLKDFADLKSLRDKLKDDEQARAIEQAEREARERKAAQEANLFRNALGGVKEMPKSDRYVPNLPASASRTLASARPLTQEEDDAEVMREMMSDQFDVEHLLENEPSISFVRQGYGQDVLRKLRKGGYEVEDELDLHGMRRDKARDELGHFLRHARQRKFRCVMVIHGKGHGSAGGEPVLRSMVHSWLEQKEDVIAFCSARIDERSHGALLVLLRSASREY